MKKIISKTDEEKRKKRNQTIGGIFLILVMIGSTFAIIVDSFGKEDSIKRINYNGIEFVKQNELWFTRIGNLNFAFKNNPKEVEKINSELNSVENYYGKPLYISSENEAAEFEISQNLNEIFQRMQKACFKNEGNLSFDASFFEEECNDNSPIKTCEDNFIIIKNNNKTKMIQEKNCVFIQGPQENLTKIADEFLFKILKIEQ